MTGTATTATLKARLEDDLKAAMRGGDTLRRDTLRFVLAAIRNDEVARLGQAIDRLTAEGKDEAARASALAHERPDVLDDAAVLEVLQKQAKMRRDSIESFRKGGREELAAKEERELAVISAYLPAQLGEDEIRAIAREEIAASGATGPREMGKVMPKVVARTKDRADGRVVSRIVGELLKSGGRVGEDPASPVRAAGPSRTEQPEGQRSE